MRVFVIILALALAPACAGAPEETSPPSHKTYPPAPSSDDVDAFGSAKDPEIAGCMSSLDNRRGFASTLVGESSVKENRSDDFKLCWCRKRGYHGLRADGSCLS